MISLAGGRKGLEAADIAKVFDFIETSSKQQNPASHLSQNSFVIFHV